jgi:predicted NBD/HSP70 family sugar kinase
MPNVRRRLAEAGPGGHSRVLATAGRRLGGALATVVSTLNLDHVVLSGPAELLAEPFRSAVIDTIRKRAIPAVAEHVELSTSSLGEDDVLLGGAVLVLAEELGVV